MGGGVCGHQCSIQQESEIQNLEYHTANNRMPWVEAWDSEYTGTLNDPKVIIWNVPKDNLRCSYQELRITMNFRVCMDGLAFPGDTPLVADSIPSDQPWNQIHRRHITCTQNILSVYLTIPEKKPCISRRSWEGLGEEREWWKSGN